MEAVCRPKSGYSSADAPQLGYKHVEIIDNVGQEWKILTSTQNKHKPTLKTADSGCNLTDDRSRNLNVQ